jgi:hypothetical protein
MRYHPKSLPVRGPAPDGKVFRLAADFFCVAFGIVFAAIVSKNSELTQHISRLGLTNCRD